MSSLRWVMERRWSLELKTQPRRVANPATRATPSQSPAARRASSADSAETPPLDTYRNVPGGAGHRHRLVQDLLIVGGSFHGYQRSSSGYVIQTTGATGPDDAWSRMRWKNSWSNMRRTSPAFDLGLFVCDAQLLLVGQAGVVVEVCHHLLDLFHSGVAPKLAAPVEAHAPVQSKVLAARGTLGPAQASDGPGPEGAALGLEEHGHEPGQLLGGGFARRPGRSV
jgi:hypothetical protein